VRTRRERPVPELDLEPVPPEKLVFEGVRKAFKTREGETVAVEDVNLSVAEGEFVVLVGPSGCGKSTLLNLVAGLDKPDAGRVLADGQPVTTAGRERMMMFQEPALYPWLDVRGNVLFGLRFKPNLNRSARRGVADFYIRKVGLQEFARANVHELSGGMRQRAALARCLACNPRVLLMDEPFAALDALTREHLYADLQRLWSERKKTILFVTHDVREAVCLGDRVVVMSPRPGRVREDFPIDLPRPRDPYSAGVAARAETIVAALRAHLGDPE
jgi:NitT/TauT family transport system ATP-binding protein